jgi:serine/threonine-protein kinase
MAALEGLEVATRPPDFTLPTTFAPTDVSLGRFEWPKRPPVPEAAPPKVSPSTPPQLRHAPELLDAVVVVRPFGFLQVDGGARSTDALARHSLKLTAGLHRFTVTCDACDPNGRTVEWSLTAGQEVPLFAPLLASLVSFAGFPDDAKVRVGAIERTVGEAKKTPFRIITPPGGSTKMQHQVEYEVTQGTAVLAKGTRWVEPGKATLIDRGAP